MPEYPARTFAPDTLYGRGTCTTGIAFNAASESRLFMTTGRAARSGPGPQSVEKRSFAVNEGPPERWETAVCCKQKLPRALRDGFSLPAPPRQVFKKRLSSLNDGFPELRAELSPKNPEILSINTDVPALRGHRSATAGGCRAHACTDCAVRTASAETSGLLRRPPPTPHEGTGTVCGTPFCVAIEGVRGESFPPRTAFRGRGGLPRRGPGRSPAAFPVFPAFPAFPFTYSVHRRSSRGTPSCRGRVRPSSRRRRRRRGGRRRRQRGRRRYSGV